MHDMQRICLSRMKFIGDVLLTTPMIQSVREKFPRAHISYLAEREALSLLQNNPHLNDLIPFDFSRPAIVEQTRVILELRKRKFDAFVDLFCNPRTALLAWASGAPIRIGKMARGRGRLYTHHVLDDGKPKPATAFHHQFVAPLGVEQRSWETKIFLQDEERRAARQYLQWQDIVSGKPVVGLHPGATWPAKRWPWERFADLADLLRAKLDAQVIVTQGPRDTETVKRLAERVSGNILVLPVMPLRQLAAIIAEMNVYVANDNGTMHIGPAVGTPTIGIFGPGEENIWFPYVPPYYDASAGHAALRKDVPCHPCHLDFCNRTGSEYMECMSLLDAREVLAIVASRIEKVLR
jgi:heptosyltransferase-3